MDDDDRNAIIKEQADKIRADINGGLLFSESIDPNNLDHVIYAAYLYGQHIAYTDIMERNERIRQLIK
jgi:hypothetical protein